MLDRIEIAMTDEILKELFITLIIFIIMGTLKLISIITKAESRLNLRQKFNIFYVNTVAGWGFFSLLVSYDEWFGELPQMVFFIMSVTYVGFNTLNSKKFLSCLQKLMQLFTKQN